MSRGGIRPACAVVRRRRRTRVPGSRRARPGRTGPQDPAPRPGWPARARPGRVGAQRATHDDDQASQGEQRDHGAGGAARRQPRSPSASATTVDATSQYPTMNGSPLATSAGMAESEPSRGHQVSAHATPTMPPRPSTSTRSGIASSFTISGYAAPLRKRYRGRHHPKVRYLGLPFVCQQCGTRLPVPPTPASTSQGTFGCGVPAQLAFVACRSTPITSRPEHPMSRSSWSC